MLGQADFASFRVLSALRAPDPHVPRWFLVCLLIFFFAADSAVALDPQTYISQYRHESWKVRDGVFSSPSRVVQTGDGYLWIGTQSGLVRFDGVRFVPWSPPPGQQLMSPRVIALLAASDGSLWIGTQRGLSHWVNHELVNYKGDEKAIVSIIQDHRGAVWVTRFDEAAPLCQVINTALRCYGKDDGIPVWHASESLVEDRAGSLWFSGDTGILRWRPGSSSLYQPTKPKSSQQLFNTALAAAPDGSMWVGIGKPGRGLGLQQLVSGVWKPFVTPGFDSSTLGVVSLLFDRENSLWIGTEDHGVYRIHDKRVDHFDSADGLSSDEVNQFYQDHEGNLWVVTRRGIDSFQDIRVASFSGREGLCTQEPYSVLASRDGTVWVGGSHGLCAVRQGGVSSWLSGEGLPGDLVTSLFEDHAGQLWVGIENTLSVYKNGRFDRIDRRDGRPIGLIADITEDVNNDIWVENIGPPRTLFLIRNRKVQSEFPTPQVPAARKVAADPSGDIWLGLMTGDLARYRSGRTETFHFDHTPGTYFNQVTVDSDGSVLGATAFALMGRKNGKQATLTVRNGLPCEGANAFVFDGQGALWLYTTCGLVEIARAELEKWWENPDVRLELRVFDVYDGVQPGTVPFQGAARSPDGRLWFVDGSVLQVLDPNHLNVNPIAPPVHVEEVIADRQSYAPRPDLRLPALTRDLEIDYTAPSFVAARRVRFRYKLEGRDLNWQDPGNRRQAFYSDLPPGNYKFHVIASNSDGLWNQQGAVLAFLVVPAWYQTIWFRVACVGSFFLLLWGVYHLRLLRMQRQFTIGLEARVHERTRIARDLHDTLLQRLHGLTFEFQAARNMLQKRPQEAMLTLDDAITGTERAITESQEAIEDLRADVVADNDIARRLREAGEELIVARAADRDLPSFGLTVEGERRNLVRSSARGSSELRVRWCATLSATRRRTGSKRTFCMAIACFECGYATMARVSTARC
jgi:ligand-binding sensor domain-containing protein